MHCHNPHNSERRKLLLKSVPQLCFECHSDIEDLATKSKVKHGALSTEKSCLNCHDPHAANVEHNLKALAYHIVPVTILSVLFVIVGVAFRTGGQF